MAPACAPTWHPRAYFGTPLTRFAPPRELHVWPKRVRPLGAPAPIKAHPSHVSCPPGGSTYGPSGCVHSVPAPSSAHLSHISCSPGSPTCGSIECVHIASLCQFRHTPHARRAPPQGALPMAPTGASTWRPRAHVGAPVTRFVPLRELHAWPQRVRPHGVPAPISAHPDESRASPGSSREQNRKGYAESRRSSHALTRTKSGTPFTHIPPHWETQLRPQCGEAAGASQYETRT